MSVDSIVAQVEADLSSDRSKERDWEGVPHGYTTIMGASGILWGSYGAG